MDKSIIGMNIKQARKEKKLTQIQLAEQIGKHESSIRKYEKGLTDIPNEVISKIADVLEVSTAELLGIPTINERVKEVRKRLHLSQEEFGNKIGLSKSGISNIENGTRNVNPKHIKLIGAVFNINESWLMTGEPDCEEEYVPPKNLSDYSTDELLQEIKRRIGGDD